MNALDVHGRYLRFGYRLAIIAVQLVLAARCSEAQRFATGGAYSSPAGVSPSSELLKNVGIDQHLGSQLPLGAIVRDESGADVRLGSYFDQKPVVVLLVQYRCPMLCTQVLNGFLKTSQGVPLEIGKDYEVITLSFDARESPELAAEKKRQYARVYRRPGAATGWHFLTAEQSAIDEITAAVGFRYSYDARSDQFAHASGLMIATPDGRMSRYFYGIEFAPSDLRLGLVESSTGKIGSAIDQVLLLCYHYDPLTGKYGLAISQVLRAAGIVTLVSMATFLLIMYRRECARTKLVRSDSDPGASMVITCMPISNREPS